MIPVEERFDYSLAFVLHKNLEEGLEVMHGLSGGGENTDGPPSHTRA